MILRITALSCLLLGVLAGAIATIGAQRSNASAQMPQGVLLETLIESQPFVPPTTPSTMSAFRLTYEPGATFDVQFGGPVALQVVSGTMAIHPDRRTSVGYHYVRDEEGLADGDLDDPKLKTNEHGETILSTGWNVTVESGQLGPTRNDGIEPLVVQAVLLYPQPLYTGAARHETSRLKTDKKRDRDGRRDVESSLDATPVQGETPVAGS